MAVFRAFPVSVVHNGQKWSASYRLDAGRVCVDSAYGSKAIKAGKDPKTQAAKLLNEIVCERLGTTH